jgi:oligoendopeptidase F
MFGEFELTIHRAAEKGEPLTGAVLTQIYGDLLKRYHGHGQVVMTIDDGCARELALVPHFCVGFHGHQYATLISGATWFAERVPRGRYQSARQFP